MARDHKRFVTEMTACLPELKASAISLCRDTARAEDLVQETVARALANESQFAIGTNMPAWLYTILRNIFRSEYRNRRREVGDADGSYAATLRSNPAQEIAVDLAKLHGALMHLPPHLRTVVELVKLRGYSYEEAARISGCPMGTIKSRINRGLMLLQRRLPLFDLGELTAVAKRGSAGEPGAKVARIWRERFHGVDDFFRPPAPSPVRRHARGSAAWQAAEAAITANGPGNTPAAAVALPARSPRHRELDSLTLTGTRFVLQSEKRKADGRVIKIFKAV